MTAGAATEVLNQTTLVNNWTGQLGGKQLYAIVIAQLQNDGKTTVVTRLSAQPIHYGKTMQESEALAVLSELGSKAMESPLVSGAK